MTSEIERLRVKLLSVNARAPQRQSDLAAGYDLYSSEDVIIGAGKRDRIKTGVAIALPRGTYGRVAPRSSLALHSGIDVGAGVIDEDYRGEVCVVLFNHGDRSFEVKVGDRIAQLIIHVIDTPSVVVVDDLDDTRRGSGGFGSTGTH